MSQTRPNVSTPNESAYGTRQNGPNVLLLEMIFWNILRMTLLDTSRMWCSALAPEEHEVVIKYILVVLIRRQRWYHLYVVLDTRLMIELKLD